MELQDFWSLGFGEKDPMKSNVVSLVIRFAI